MKQIRRAIGGLAVALTVAMMPTAWADSDVKEIALKDGSTLLVFKDGKMSMRDARGRVTAMKDGQQMETKDGKVFVMKGNEIWRKTTAEQLADERNRGGG